MKWKRPRRSDLDESIGPCSCCPIRWSTTRMPGTGAESASRTRPIVRVCAETEAGTRNERRGRTERNTAEKARGFLSPAFINSLRIELPEVLGIHLLEVVLQLVRFERWIGRGFVGFDAALIEQLIASEDGSAHAQRQGDAVGGSGIDLEDMVVPPDQQLGKVGVLLH